MEISEQRLKQLEKAERKLQALEAGGVDNWEWYGESLKEFFKENEVEDLVKEVVEDIQETFSLNAGYDFPAGREAGISVWCEDESALEKIVFDAFKKYKELLEEDCCG